MKPKLLITGASGFLGHHLLRIAGDWELYGLYNTKPATCNGATLLPCNITNYVELGNYIEDIEPDAVIHAAAISDANYCQQYPDLSNSVNVEASRNLAGICSDYNIPFVFTSTDLVFDGLKGSYTEEDEPNPVNLYGEQKAKAEREVLSIYPLATVLRLPLMFGHPQASAANYLQKFIAQLKQGEKAKLFTDEYRSVCGAASISKGILQFMAQSGILHLAGKERLSRYEFGIKAAEVFGLDKKLIEACKQSDVAMAAPRPPDVSLNISKAIALGYNPLSVEEELMAIASGSYAGNSK